MSASNGSLSLVHFLGSAGSGSGGSSRRTRSLRQLASTQVVLSQPGSPSQQQHAEGAAAAAATVGAAAAIGAQGAGQRGSNGSASRRQPPHAATVQRRLSKIQSGHYISLHKLRSQCGDFTGELQPAAGTAWIPAGCLNRWSSFMQACKPACLPCKSLTHL